MGNPYRLGLRFRCDTRPFCVWREVPFKIVIGLGVQSIRNPDRTSLSQEGKHQGPAMFSLTYLPLSRGPRDWPS